MFHVYQANQRQNSEKQFIVNQLYQFNDWMSTQSESCTTVVDVYNTKKAWIKCRNTLPGCGHDL